MYFGESLFSYILASAAWPAGLGRLARPLDRLVSLLLNRARQDNGGVLPETISDIFERCWGCDTQTYEEDVSL